MPFIKEETLDKVNVRELSTFLGLAGLVMFLPFFIHIQWLTGPVINTLLIIVLFIVGIRSALVLALVPSLMALAGGLLPAVLAPVVPFVMISNVIYIIVIDWFYNNSKSTGKGYWIGVVAGSCLKFIFLFSSVTFIVKLLTKQELVIKVSQMMAWPQLMTALLGGVIAWGILKWLKRF